MKLQSDLREFVELLNSHGVEFLIVGGHAVAFHGYPRFTGDVDIFVRSSVQNSRRLARVLKDFGFGDQGVDETTFTEPDLVVQLGRPPNRIDLLTTLTGLEFDRAWSERVIGELDGIPVAFPSRQGLLDNKRATGRTKDLADVEEITKRLDADE